MTKTSLHQWNSCFSPTNTRPPSPKSDTEVDRQRQGQVDRSILSEEDSTMWEWGDLPRRPEEGEPPTEQSKEALDKGGGCPLWVQFIYHMYLVYVQCYLWSGVILWLGCIKNQVILLSRNFGRFQGCIFLKPTWMQNFCRTALSLMYTCSFVDI